ncbi:MAG: FAD-dependent oxidoreductase [Candidatus Paceibacterota bacterium]|jgi:alkyl hydroperoxide reductase subunit F
MNPESNLYDLAIIGGGPAGVGAGVYASRKKLKTVLITKDFQGQSSVSEGIENWIGTIKISGADLAKSLENHLRAYADDTVDIKTGEFCSKIEKTDSGFKVATNKSSYEVKTVLITAGSRRRKLEAKGADKFEHNGITYCASCDGPLFAGQDVAVVGGGNAAFETVAQLAAYCKSVTLINRSENFRADPITVEKISKNPKVKILTNTVVVEAKGDKFLKSIILGNLISKKETGLPISGVFVEIGSVPNTDFSKDVVEHDQYNRIVVDPKNQESKTEGIWAAGDCTDGLYHQNNIAVGDAIKAVEDIYLHIHTR